MIAHFERNAATGTLSLVDIQRDGVNGVDGIDRVMDVVVSPDGRGVYAVGEWENGYHLYAVGYYDSAIAVFQVKTPADTDTDDETDNGLTIAPAGDGGGGCFLKAL